MKPFLLVFKENWLGDMKLSSVWVIIWIIKTKLATIKMLFAEYHEMCITIHNKGAVGCPIYYDIYMYINFDSVGNNIWEFL